MSWYINTGANPYNMHTKLLKFIIFSAYCIVGIDVSASPEMDPLAITEGDYYWSQSDHKSELRDITQGTFSENLWQSFEFGFQKKTTNGESILWQRITFETSELKSPALYLENVDQDFEIYHEDKLIYKHGTLNDDGIGKFMGWGWHLIDLPPNTKEDKLYFLIYSNHDNIGITGIPRVGEKYSLLKNIIMTGLPHVGVLLFQLIIGLIGLAIFVFAYRDQQLFFAGSFTSVLSLYFISRTPIAQIILSDLSFKTYLELYALYLFPISLTAFFGSMILHPKYHKVFSISAAIFGLIALSAMTSHIIFDIHPRKFLLANQVVLILSFLNYTVALVYLYIVRPEKEFKLFVLGMALASSGGFADTLKALNLISFSTQLPLSSLGMLAMNLGSLNVAITRIRKDVARKNELEKRTREQQIEEYRNKMAALKTMAGGIAHEINNPLFIIEGCSSIIRSSADNDKLDQNMLIKNTDKIHQSVERVANITDNLLILAQEKKKFLKEQVINIDDIICTVITNFYTPILENKIAIKVHPDINESYVKGHVSEFVTAISAVFENALEACATRDIKWVRIQTRVTDKIEILIIDSGEGVKESIKEDIMLPFFSTKTEYKNSQSVGLGLGVAQGIVENNKGSLHQDRSQKFTTFVITLPIHDKISDESNQDSEETEDEIVS